jgi:hypothetical protein
LFISEQKHATKKRGNVMKNLKSIALSLMLALFGLGLEANVFAGDKETAESLFKARDLDTVGVKKALDAANLFYKAGQSESDMDQKVLCLTKSAEALYFYADNNSDNKIKIKYFLQAANYAMEAAKPLEAKPGKVKVAGKEAALATAYYWFGASKARWAEANGVLNSLTEWPTVKEYMNYIIKDLKQASLISYGANRILGKAYMKLPWPMGSKDWSYDYLKEAFDNTSANDPDGISNYGINVLFYAEILVEKGDKDLAREILNILISKESNLEAYNADRIPESKKEIREAKDLLKKIGG